MILVVILVLKVYKYFIFLIWEWNVDNKNLFSYDENEFYLLYFEILGFSKKIIEFLFVFLYWVLEKFVGDLENINKRYI